MPKSVFLFLAVTLILLQLFSLSIDSLRTSIDLLSLVAILTLGVAHGSIDHLLFGMKNNKTNKTHFIIIYLAVLAANFVLWYILSEIALFLFLAFSAYHFGQSQFIELNIKQKVLSKALYFSWGASILAGLIYFNSNEVNKLFYDPVSNSNVFESIINNIELYFTLFGIAALLISIYLLINKSISIQTFGLELLQYLIIISAFYLFPIVLGFSLYFIILHSFRVLLQEYDFLKKSYRIKNVFQFVKLLFPFTLISVIGLGLILSSVYFFDLKIALPYLLIALTSAVTIPHALVMEVFYYKK